MVHWFIPFSQQAIKKPLIAEPLVAYFFNFLLFLVIEYLRFNTNGVLVILSNQYFLTVQR